jgi:hypothetical protein
MALPATAIARRIGMMSCEKPKKRARPPAFLWWWIVLTSLLASWFSRRMFANAFDLPDYR